MKSASPNAAVICVTPWNTAGRLRDYTPAIEAACGEVGARVTNISDIYAATNTRAHKGEPYYGGTVPDDAHPNDAGHRAIADLILEWIVLA